MERLELEATRGDAWQPTIEYSYEGTLPEGATARLQWRLYEGAPGAPLLDIPSCPFEDGLASAEDIAAGFARRGDRILRLLPDVTVPDDLPSGQNQPEPGEADRYAWDVAIVVSGNVVLRPLGGFVIVNKGVTRFDA